MTALLPIAILRDLLEANSTTWILCGAVLVIVGHCLLALAYIGVRYEPRQWLLRVLDAGSYPEGPLWQSLLEAIQEMLSKRLESRVKSRGEVRRGVPHQESLVSGSTSCVYRLERRIAIGDLCDVHMATDGRDHFVVKIPRVSRCNDLIQNEQKVLAELQEHSESDLYGKYFPKPVETLWNRDRLVSVHQWRRGLYSATQIREQHPDGVDARHLAWMFNRTLEGLGFVHRAGWVHGAVQPSHLLFDTENHGLQIVGWIQAVQSGEPLQVASRRAATPGVDVCMAAKTMFWLAGGDSNGNSIPTEMPADFKSFLHQCINRSQSDDVDAWSLHQEFRELLEDLFGPPKFCHLRML